MYKKINRNKMNGKTTAHVKSVVKSQMVELIRNQQLKTTPLKARILKAQFDKLVNMSKKNTVSSKKEVEAFFGTNERAVERFYTVVEKLLQDRNSGYTRIIRTLPRKGDGAEQAYIMLVNTTEAKEKKSEVEKLLEKKQKEKAEKSVGGRVKKALKRN